MTLDATTLDAQTLSQRLAAGRLPLSDTLRYAMQMADALRRVHEERSFHGAVTPDAFVFTPAGLQLAPAHPGAIETLTPYTAPERLKGQPPDVRTDIFGFGAVLYEMLSGRRAFEGDQPEALADSIATVVPEPLGDPALDRLVFNCVVKDPAGRWQRIQQVQMELKILNFSASRAQAAATPRQSYPALLAELRQLESRVSSRLEAQAAAVADLRRVAAERAAAAQTTAALPARLEAQEAAVAELRRVASEQAAAVQTTAELPGRLEAQEAAVAELRRMASEHAAAVQTTAELPARLEAQEAADRKSVV